MNRDYIVEIGDECLFHPYWWDEFPELHADETWPRAEIEVCRLIVSGTDEDDVMNRLHEGLIKNFIDDKGYHYTIDDLIGCKIGKITLKENN